MAGGIVYQNLHDQPTGLEQPGWGPNFAGPAGWAQPGWEPKLAGPPDRLGAARQAAAQTLLDLLAGLAQPGLEPKFAGWTSRLTGLEQPFDFDFASLPNESLLVQHS